MNDIQQSVLGKLKELPLDKQEEVLDFVEFLLKSLARACRGFGATLKLT